MTHSKFDLNVPRRCRDIASETAWHHAINFIDALLENGLYYQQSFNILLGFANIGGI